MRLPTEAEWEWAARGPEGRRYPWNDAWDTLRANTIESKIYRTTAVGLYPSGAAVVGQAAGEGGGRIYDLAGNVWEWTASAYSMDYAQPQGLAQGETDRRVLRGGSWDIDPRRARAACRFGLVTGLCGNFVGFRLALCAPHR